MAEKGDFSGVWPSISRAQSGLQRTASSSAPSPLEAEFYHNSGTGLDEDVSVEGSDADLPAYTPWGATGMEVTQEGLHTSTMVTGNFHPHLVRRTC